MAETGMVEKVARAIWEGENDAIRRLAPPWDSDPTRKGMLLRAARAAIEAMREPNGRMLFAGYCALVAEWPKDWHADGATPEGYSAKLAYTAMIDAILKEGQ